MSHVTPRDPAQHLILRTLLAPAAVIVALLILLFPALSQAAPTADAPTVLADDATHGVHKVSVRVRPDGDGMQVDFVVKLERDADVPRLRAEYAATGGWKSVELTRSGARRFVGTVTLPFKADISFFLLGADTDGAINDVRYGTLFQPALILAPAQG